MGVDGAPAMEPLLRLSQQIHSGENWAQQVSYVHTREDFDNLVYDGNDVEWEKVQPKIRQKSTIRLVEAFSNKDRGSSTQ